jgi:TRAP-type C4-dicarboxylate transport system permease small subunit
MLRAMLKTVTLTESIAATIAYAVVAVILMVDVIGREVFSTSFLGLQQLAVYGAIIAGFLGLTLATSDNAHLRPAFLDRLAPTALEPMVQRLGDLVSAGFFFAGAWVCWSFVAYSMEVGDRAPVMYFLLWPLQLVIPYAFASAGLKHLIFAADPALKPAASETAG